jgi:hypothetical protein
LYIAASAEYEVILSYVADRFWMMVSREVVWAKEAATMTSETAVDLRRIFFIGGSGIIGLI